jgi:hypothetical protein
MQAARPCADFARTIPVGPSQSRAVQFDVTSAGRFVVVESGLPSGMQTITVRSAKVLSDTCQ